MNANFFANGKLKKSDPNFTYPVNFLIADYKNEDKNCQKFDESRGSLVNGKYYFDSYCIGQPGEQFYHKKLTTFYIDGYGRPGIEDIDKIDMSWKYAVAGIPIMKNGEDVKWLTYVKPQGWTGGELYSTYHIFLGLGEDKKKIYLLNWQSSGANMIYAATAFKEFTQKLKIKLRDVIKLDGGGSCIMKYKGQTKQATNENRQINAIIKIDDKSVEGYFCNPYPQPKRTLNRYIKGEDVKWVQFQLQKAGVDCGEIDGSYGNGTFAAVKQF